VTVVWVALGASVGAPLRFLIDRGIQVRHDTVFPWGTLTANLAGCLMLGFLVAALTRLPPAVEATLGTGFCGALTTYSTFSYETLRLLEGGARFYAVTYLVASLLGGFGAVGLGWTVGTWLAG
jgi:CrcB protein